MKLASFAEVQPVLCKSMKFSAYGKCVCNKKTRLLVLGGQATASAIYLLSIKFLFCEKLTLLCEISIAVYYKSLSKRGNACQYD